MTLLTYIMRRAAHYWQILLTLTVGVFLAVALLAAAPLLVNTVIELGLRRVLLSADPLVGNLRLKASDELDAAEFAAVDQSVKDHLTARLDPQIARIIPTVGSRWLFPWTDGVPIADQRVNFRLYGDTNENNVQDRVTLIAGMWPDKPVVADGVVTAVITPDMAEAYGLEVGDKLPLSFKTEDRNPTLLLQISGIIRAINPNDPFWFGDYSPLQTQSDNRWRAQYAIIVQPDQFFPLIDAISPRMNGNLAWQVLLDPGHFTINDMVPVRHHLEMLGTELRRLSPAITIDTSLPERLTAFSRQAGAIRTPLYFLTAEIVLLTLYYVMMVSVLAVQQFRREFAVLQSRGASTRQLFRIQAGEAVLISTAAWISGPLLAVGLVRGLMIAGPLADISEPDWALTVPQAAWLAAGVGAVACIIGLLLPAQTAVSGSIITHQQTAVRDNQRPWWQRLYLDVFILLIGLILLWRLQIYGSIIGGTVARPSIDWLLLFSPLALLIGAGTILLRLFPLFLRFLAALSHHGRGLPAALAMWQASRYPSHVARLVLLLTLAMALGILTTGLNATLDLSETERAQYSAGSDLWLTSQRPLLISSLADIPGIQASTAMWRKRGGVTNGRSYRPFQVLAIDPTSFIPITHYRDDFASQPVPELINQLAVKPDVLAQQPTLTVPGQPQQFGFWAWSESDPPAEENTFQPLVGDSNLDRIGFEAKFQTVEGEMFTVELAPRRLARAQRNDWLYFRAEMPQFPDSSYPLGLDSIWIRNRFRILGVDGIARPTAAEFQLYLDAFLVEDISGETAVFADMEKRDAIWTLAHLASPQIIDEYAFAGTYSLRIDLTMDAVEQLPLRLTTIADSDPLPVLVSPAFRAQTGAVIGQQLEVTIDSQPIVIHIIDEVTYFPTLYEELEAGYMITNREVLLAYLNRQFSRSFNANEALLQLEPGADEVAVETAVFTALPTINYIVSTDTVRKAIKADPMGLGLRSVTFFGYVLTTALSLIGFATHFYMNARQREPAYSILRSIGMSPRQLYTMLLLEQIVLILVGLVIGTVLGVLLNQITLPGLPITLGDRPPIPPFRVRSDWWAVGRIYLTLATAFLVALSIASTLLWRVKLHRVLRVGEE